MSLFQVQSTEAARCSANFTQISADTNSAVVTFNTSALFCNFTVFTAEESRADGTACEPHGELSNTFICQITDLEPGTLYRLAVISKKDGERSNASVRTGKNHPGGFI